MNEAVEQKKNWTIFLSSVFFVLGFSTVFSLVGILLQTILANVSYSAQVWLGRVGGGIIILFGLFLVGLLKPKFLQRDHKVQVAGQFKSYWVTSFLFGAAFAAGWTPCVTAALGAILVLATTQAGSAFFLLMAYTFGIGIPFLMVGLFADQVQGVIERAGRWLIYIQYAFGVLLIGMGVLIFVGQLSRIANFEVLTNVLLALDISTGVGGNIGSLSVLNIGIAFIAGLVSFLSPCILPLIPGFLSYLASTASRE